MKSEPPRVIGVLTPYTGGFYYGAILEGVQRAAGLRQASVFALQTTGLDSHWSLEGRTLSIDAADAWIVANEAATDPYVEHIMKAGKPLAFVHARRSGLASCAVLPDNVGGMRDAVSHLIAHGHRRIAFAGCRSQLDIDERYQGYLQAHNEAGLSVCPELLLSSSANMEADGRAVGQQLLMANMPCTAVAAGTDKVALGIMEVLRGSRHRVPHDVALVGFDDVEQAQYAAPPLSTVRQTFQVVAAAASNALLNHLETGLPMPEEIRVPVLFVQRQSCGCLTSDVSFDEGLQGPQEQAASELTNALLRIAGSSLADPATEAEWPGAREIAERVRAELAGQTVESDYSADLWAGFLEFNRDAEAIDRASTLLDSFIKAMLPSEGVKDRRRQLSRDLRVSLLRSWQGAEQKRIRLYEWVAESSYHINNALAIARTDEPPDLSWLRFTHAQYGCLGLWKRDANGERVLEIVAEHGAQLVGVGETARFAPEVFPPPAFTGAMRELSRQNLVTIVPLRSRSSNHGLLVVAAPVALELIDHVGNVGDWGERIGALLEQVEVEQQLRENVLSDALTGLPNRAALVAHLTELAAAPQATSVALVLLDLDDFKKVNDSLGHPAGDALLTQLADRLRRIVGPEHLIVRLGGDEFVIALKDVTSEASAISLAQQIHEDLRQPFELTNELAFVSCSIGIVLPERTGFSASELLRDADTAMHRAKMLGAGNHALFHRGMREQAVERQRLDVHLRRALTNGEFELYYQPVVSLKSGSAIGAEALIRWNHPEQGCLAPGRFLSVAEEVGMIIPIGKWVLETACAHAVAWQRFGRPVYVNVNVSVQHLQEPGFLAFVEKVLADSGLPAPLLGIELVENKLVEKVELVTRTLSELMRLGVRVAVDDFGTGYSSLAYLKNLPVDTLKLDRSFVSGVPLSVSDSAIVSAVLTMGRGLGLAVVAEGVETADQLEYLVSQGCEVAQGYYFSKPVQLAQWEARLRASGAYQLPKQRAYSGFSSQRALDP